MKKMNVTREQALRWGAQGMMAVIVLVGAYAVMQHLKAGELESSLSQIKAEAQKANQDSAAARKKLQDELKAAGEKVASLGAKQREMDNITTLLAKIEPQIASALEAAGKAGKPDVRAAVLTGIGLIGQIAHGANNDAALGALDRALAADKGNCIAGLAVNLSGTKKIDVAAECQALLPASAAEAKPAAAPAAAPAPAGSPAAASAAPAAAPPAAPAAGAGKAAEPAGK